MKTKSFIFLVVSIIFLIFAVAYLYFYTSTKTQIQTVITNVVKQDNKPSETEIAKALEEIKNPEPLTEQKKNELEKALSEIKNVNGAASNKTNISVAEQSVIADKERDRNREAISKALNEIRN